MGKLTGSEDPPIRAPRPSLLVLIAFWVFSFAVVPGLLLAAGVDFSAPDTWPSSAWGAFAVAALVADAALAVPTGVIATALGATYGVAGGTAIAVFGIGGATMTGWFLGRGGSALARAIPDDDPVRAAVARWGMGALIALRPIPVLSETAALLAGSEGLPFGRALIASVLGALPTALLYTTLGAGARANEAPGWLPYAAALALGAGSTALGMWLTRRARAEAAAGSELR